jgi:hypothetical protein
MCCGGVGLRKSLVIAMQQSRQTVIDVLNRLGHTELADEASRVLPDPVDVDQLQACGMQHGISPSEIMSELGGSP